MKTKIMSLFRTPRMVLVVAAAALLHCDAAADTINLGTAGNFAVLAGETVTNTGPTVINAGNVGVSAGSAITGFLPGIVNPPYTFHAADAVAAQAQLDLTTAFIDAAGRASTQSMAPELAGLTLTPGVYTFGSTASLAVGGTLTLDALSDPDALFIFQIGSSLTVGSGASVVWLNGLEGCEVFWQVGSSATIGTNAHFVGHILASTSITLETGAALHGSALASTGAVTLDSNLITNAVCDAGGTAVPDGGSTLLLFGGGLAVLSGLGRRFRAFGCGRCGAKLPRQSP